MTKTTKCIKINENVLSIDINIYLKYITKNIHINQILRLTEQYICTTENSSKIYNSYKNMQYSMKIVKFTKFLLKFENTGNRICQRNNI